MQKQHHTSAGKSHTCTSAQATLPSDLHGKQSGIILVQRSHGGAFHPGGMSPAILSLVPPSPTPPPARQQMLFGDVVRCANNERGSSCGSLCVALSMLWHAGRRVCGVTCVEASNGTLEHHNEHEGATKFFGCVSKLDFFSSIFREEAEGISLKYTSKTQEGGIKNPKSDDAWVGACLASPLCRPDWTTGMRVVW